MRTGYDIKKKISGIVLLLLFGVYFAGITSFPHIHEDGGSRLVHSHPYAGNHSHTDQSISAIGNLALFDTAPISPYALSDVECRDIEKTQYEIPHFVKDPAASYKLLRAPPVVG